MGDYDQLSDPEKVKVVENFLKNAPPGEFNEVFNDVRILLADDRLLKEKATGAFAAYDTDQFTPCKLPSVENPVLITEHGNLDPGQFYDPSTKQRFHYDHLRKEASDVEPHEYNESGEEWRSSLEESLREYLGLHYPDGNMSVYCPNAEGGGETKVIICFEDHQFQPQNFWNGRWRSEWTVTFDPSNLEEKASMKGMLRLQVHYYEDGNVQLVSNKEVEITDIAVQDPKHFAGEVKKALKSAESVYQQAINENYEKMSITAFKSLRRQLPITRTKIDWNKIVSYQVGKDLKS